MQKQEGWKNEQTRALYTWITGTEGSYKAYIATAADALQAAGGDADRAKVTLSRAIQEDIEAGNPTQGGFYGDVMGLALRAIDYYDVAAAILEDVAE